LPAGNWPEGCFFPEGKKERLRASDQGKNKTRGFFSGFEKVTRIIEKTKTRETLFVFEMIRVFSRNQLKMHRF
jgi:hypothetical protein